MSLRKVFEPYFKIGTSVSRWNMQSDEAKKELVKHYNSITGENDMKPMFMLDEETTLSDPAKYDKAAALKFDTAIPYLEFAKQNGIALRGHTLVWHNQTSIWFFKKDYQNDWEAPNADRETMLARMENYIKGVLEFVQTNYPGVIYAWDVVNEAIDDADEEGWRVKSPWRQIIGEDFLYHAFRFARKYAAKDVKLFYNDYNSFNPAKREKICNLILKPLIEEKVIDGMGMQGHLVLGDSSLKEIEEALHKYGSFGLDIHVTELDIHCTDASAEGQKVLADYYKDLFRIYLNAKKKGLANLTCVTFWGMKDDESWLTGFRKERSYPLLFGDNYEQKQAYDAVVSLVDEM